jgi:hypothetical protein
MPGLFTLIALAKAPRREVKNALLIALRIANSHQTTFEQNQRAHIHNPKEREFALFDKALDMQMPRAGRDIPIDLVLVIVFLIGTHLVKLQAHAFEDTHILPTEHLFNQVAGFDFEAVNALPGIGQWHTHIE